MRRSAAPSSQNGGPGKRFKFNSPLTTNKQISSPTPMPMRDLKDTESYLNVPKNKNKETLETVNFHKNSEKAFQHPDNKKLVEKVNKFVVPRKNNMLKENHINNHKIPNEVENLFSKSYDRKEPSAVDKSCLPATGSLLKLSCSNDPPIGISSKRFFKALIAKFSKKKHKIWEGDGFVIVENTLIELYDDKNKLLAKKTQCKKAEIDAIEYGYSFVIGGKDVLLDEEISMDIFNNRNCATSVLLTSDDSQNNQPVSQLNNPLKKYGFSRGEKANKTKPKARHDPNAHNAVVLSDSLETSVTVVLDPFLADKMRPHQIEGTKFLYKCVMGNKNAGLGAILADEMGLGKTLQCIALMWTLLKQGPCGYPICKKCIVITPSSLVNNWKSEFKKWLGDERVKVWGLTAGESSVKDFASSPLYSVLVISYEMFRKNINELLLIEWGIVVCDEGHRLKNTGAKIGEALFKLPCKRRVILTGTPVQNNLKEFYTLANFVNPTVFGSTRTFCNIYADPIQTSLLPTATNAQQALGKTRTDELAEITSQFILRRTNKINEKYLPAKEENVLFCKASKRVRDLYSSVLSHTDLLTTPQSGIFNLIGKLKKLCNHPCLIDVDQSGVKEVQVADSTKLVVTSDIIISQTKKGHKIVIVSNYTKTLDILSYLCDSLQLQYHRLDGKTPQSKRQNMVDLFNSSYDKRLVFLLSSKAGGVGLNLVGGNVIIMYDLDWNPSNDQQAMARVWRDGQKKEVKIYRLITAGTIEEKIFQRQIRKQGLSTCVVDNEMETCNFTLEELKDIFSCNFDTVSTTHDLLKCQCNGSHRPSIRQKTNEAGDSNKSDMGELMNWDHLHHSDPNVTLQFVKFSSN